MNKTIRKLTESDQENLLAYLYEEEACNVVLIANIHIRGFKDESRDIYGEFDDFNNYLSVSLIFSGTGVLIYSKNRLFNEEWLNLYNKYELTYVGGLESIIEKVIPYFKDFKILRSFAAIASKVNKKTEKSNLKIIRATTEEECERIYELLKPMNEFSTRTNNKEEFMKAKMETLDTGSTYYIEEEGKVIATASAVNVTNNYILVNMVGTALEARGKGLATIIMNHLMIHYIEERHKSIFLYYDYPEVGYFYQKLGFKEIDRWVGLEKK